MNRGSVRREMLDLPPGSVRDAEIVDFAINAAKVASLTFDATTENSKFASDARPSRSRGASMCNRLTMLGVPGIIVQGNTVVIGADTYEFRDSTPPVGGTAGRIWVFNGTGGAADAVISRANFVLAVNGGGTALEVTRTSVTNPTAGTNTELVTATQTGQVLGNIRVYSSTAIGSGVAAASGTATATTETLTTVTDIWDQATMYGGTAEAAGSVAFTSIIVTAAMRAKLCLEAQFPFTPATAYVVDRSRPHDQITTIGTLGRVSVTLSAAGAAPNIQTGDTIDIVAFGP
jgi:hypothetical protein